MSRLLSERPLNSRSSSTSSFLKKVPGFRSDYEKCLLKTERLVREMELWVEGHPGMITDGYLERFETLKEQLQDIQDNKPSFIAQRLKGSSVEVETVGQDLALVFQDFKDDVKATSKSHFGDKLRGGERLARPLSQWPVFEVKLVPIGKTETLTISVDRDPVTFGGFGEIYVGTVGVEPEMTILALKKALGPKDKDRERIIREGDVWARFNHPHILPYWGVAQDTYLVSVFVEFTLEDYLQEHPDADKLFILRGLAAALTHMHEHPEEWVHGDVKGQNALVRSDGWAFLCDFGLSKISGTNTTTGAHGQGTTYYLSPERLQHARKSLKDDVYAFGVLIAEVVRNGVNPWLPDPSIRFSYADHYSEVVTQGARPPVPAEGGPLWALAVRCWATNPDARPSMTEVVTILDSM